MKSVNVVKRTAKNTGLLILSDVIGIILYYLLIIAIARNLGDVEFGKFSFAFAFVALFVFFADLGMSKLMIREIARKRESAGKYLGNAAMIKVVLSCVAFTLIFVVINLLHYPADTVKVVYIAGLSVILTNFSQLFRSVFYAFEKMQYEALNRVLEKAVAFSLGMLAISYGYDLAGVVVAFLVSSILSVLFSFLIAAKKFARPSLKIDLRFCRNLIKESISFGLAAMLIMIYFRIDIVMLSLMKGDAVVGWYSAASKIIEALNFIPAAFTIAVFPLLSIYFEKSRKSLELVYQKSFKLLLILGIPTAVGITLLADKLIIFVYGMEYVNSIGALKILIWAEAIIFLTYLCMYVLGAINKQHAVVYIAGFNVVLNVLLNLLLIPKFSLIGAAIATVVTEGSGLFLMLYFISQSMKIQMHRFVIKPLIASGFMGVTLVFLNVFSLFILIPLGAFVYFGALVMLKTFSREDADLLRLVFRRS